MLKNRKITGFVKPVTALADTPKMSAQKLKEWFDSNSTGELKTAVNGVIDDLTGPDGASNIGTAYGMLNDVITYLREKTGSDEEYNNFLSLLARLTKQSQEAYDQYLIDVGGLEQSAQTELTNFLAWIAASRVRSSTQLETAFQEYMAQLNGLEDGAQTELSSFMAWIASSKQSSAAEMRSWLDAIKDILSEDVAGNLLVLIQALQADQPTRQVATLTGVAEADGKLADCTLYATEYAMGVGGIGEGPIGGGPLVSQPLKTTQNFDGTVAVKTLPEYAAMTETHTAGGGLYTLCGADGPRSLVLAAK